MRDIAFSPDHITVDHGETVRLVFHNKGAAVHDAFVGDEGAQDDHEMEMRDQEDSDMGHGTTGDHEDGITVPGDTGEFTHTFTDAGTTVIGSQPAGPPQPDTDAKKAVARA